MFEVGDLAFYPNHGIGKIEKIIQMEVGEQKIKCFQIRILERGVTVKVPIDRAEALGLRGIIPTKEVPRILTILKTRGNADNYRTWNKRFREYTQKLRTGSPFEIAEVLRDLMQLQSSKELSFGERKMLDQAKALLIKELAFALESDEDELVSQVQDVVVGKRQRLTCGSRSARA
ncbi:MAG: CarD family transcriptional regulator [Candidatus Dadabacteria bacterium]|nr:MAG: CarD family transcriptional regulator [Candidatus Dadabacteria bacterium]